VGQISAGKLMKAKPSLGRERADWLITPWNKSHAGFTLLPLSSDFQSGEKSHRQRDDNDA
jgi:hypothetical protein